MARLIRWTAALSVLLISAGCCTKPPLRAEQLAGPAVFATERQARAAGLTPSVRPKRDPSGLKIITSDEGLICYIGPCEGEAREICYFDHEGGCSICFWEGGPPCEDPDARKASTVVATRSRTFSHRLGIGNPPPVFDVNPGGVITLIEAYGQNAAAFLNCDEYKLNWTITVVGDKRLIQRGCPNMALYANGLATGSSPVIVKIQVDD